MMSLIGSKINTRILISNFTRYTKLKSLGKLLEGLRSDIASFDVVPYKIVKDPVRRENAREIRFHLRVTIMPLNKQLFIASPAPM